MGRPLFTVLAAAILLAAPLAGQTHTVALTIDDLPFVSSDPSHPSPAALASTASQANSTVLRALRRHHVPVTGFVNQKWVEEIASGTGILDAWIDAGFDLGNHTYSHSDFNDLTPEQFEQDVIRGEVGLFPRMQAAGRTTKFFRFPFNHTGDTAEKHQAVAAFLGARGYLQAPCTIETSDYLFNHAYEKMVARHDREAAARLRGDYIAFTAMQIDYFDRLNRQVLGYDAPQVMLIHDNRLNAEMIEQILSIFESKHYVFISLSQAETDPVYQHADSLVTRFGPMWGYRWARERGVKVDGRLEPEPPKWISEDGGETPPARRPRSAF